MRRSAAREDLVQDTWFAVWRAAFRRERSEHTFLYRIAHDRALTHVARRHPLTDDLGAAEE